MKRLKESSVHSRALWIFTMWSIKVGLNVIKYWFVFFPSHKMHRINCCRNYMKFQRSRQAVTSSHLGSHLLNCIKAVPCTFIIKVNYIPVAVLPQCVLILFDMDVIVTSELYCTFMQRTRCIVFSVCNKMPRLFFLFLHYIHKIQVSAGVLGVNYSIHSLCGWKRTVLPECT